MGPDPELRPLTARSVLVSTLLGSDPPRLPVAFLVRTGAIFGLSEGAVRTALSRMVAAGDVRTRGDGWYALTEPLVERRDRQERSRAAALLDWSGAWWVGVVGSGARAPRERAVLRAAMERHHLAELRDGVWVRPDNLGGAARPDLGALGASCTWFRGAPDLGIERSEAELAAELWDLETWSVGATLLRRSMHGMLRRLDADDVEALAPAFVLSAAVLRHFLTDPLLPRELLPRGWPGDALRRDYDRYDEAFRRLLTAWSRPRADDR